ncbi:MAG TPA: VWA domain-containing protein [Taishania sp.]|nr:VWA domain-containing protein [Taishania sp.]
MFKQEQTYNSMQLARNILIFEVVFWLICSLLYLNTQTIFGSEFVFVKAKYLAWLIICIPIGMGFLYRDNLNNKMLHNVGELARKTILKSKPIYKTFIAYILIRLAVFFVIVALAQPAFGKKKVAGTTKSMELVICLDVSNSMNTRDIDPTISRLNIAKRAINDLINRLGGEKIGLTIFAQDAYVQLPLTLDYYAAKMFVNDIQTDMLTNQGTNIKVALETARSLFNENSKLSKAVILITDGENHEDNPNEILQAYKDEDIQLVVCGIGSAKGGLIPIDPENLDKGYKRNALGVTIQSKMNSRLINEIAAKAGGVAMIADNAYPDLNASLNKVGQLKMTETTSHDFEVANQQYQIPLIIGILFYLLYLIFINQDGFKSKKVFGLCIIPFMLLSNQYAYSQEWRDSLAAARKAYQAKEYGKAFNLYKAAQSKAPKDISFAQEMGQSAYRNLQYEEAEAIFREQASGAKTTQEKAKAYHNLGNSLMQQKKYDSAIEAYKQSLKNDAQNERTRHNLAEAMRLKKEQENKSNKKDQQEQQNDQNDQKNDDSKSDKQSNQSNQNQQQKDQQQKNQQSKGNNQSNSTNQSGTKLQDKAVEKKLDELMKQEAETKRRMGGNKNSNRYSKLGKDW